MTAFALLFTLAAIGVAETSYLVRKRKLSERPICPIGGSCVTVLTSKYNNMLGFVHNDILGLLFYCSLLIVTGMSVIGVGPLELMNLYVNYSVAAAFLMSLGLVFIMWRILKAWCTWCLLSAVTILLMSIILLTHNFALIS